MADTKISALASGSPAAATDVTVIARGGANYKLALSDIWTIATGSQLLAPVGSAAAPSISFASQTSSGLYAIGSGAVAMSGGNFNTMAWYGVESILPSTGVLNWSSTTNVSAGRDTGLARSAAGVVKVTDGSTNLGRILTGGGSVTSPALAIGSSDGTNAQNGFYSTGVNGIGFTRNGALLFTIAHVLGTDFNLNSAMPLNWSSGAATAAADVGLKRNAAGILQVTDGSSGSGRIYVADGTRALPSLSFTSEPDSGMYVVGASEVGLSVNDTLFYSMAQAGAQHRWYVSNVERMRFNSTVGLNLDSLIPLTWGTALGSKDIGLARAAAGIVAVTDGSTGSASARFGSTGTILWTNTTDPIGGASDTRLSKAAAQVLSIDNAAGTVMGALRRAIDFANVTTTTNSTIQQSGICFTNTGAGGTATVNLVDNAPSGTFYDFVVTVALSLDVVVSSGESIQDGASNGTTKITSNTIGSTLRLLAVGGAGGKWFVMSKSGTWTLS